MSDLKEVNTVRETAAYLGKSVLTIRNWIAAGKLKASRPVDGGTYMISAESIRAVLGQGSEVKP